MLVTLALALTAGAGRLQAPPDTGLARALAYIDAAVKERLLEDGTPGLALAVVADGRVIAARGYGVADLASSTPVAPDTRFLAGSLSKAFTAVALLQLAEEGLVDLQRPVVDYLPWFRMRRGAGSITLHHLLTHTAGLPRDRSDLPSSPYTALALRDRTLVSAPGERFAYSNIGYQLLSLVIEEVEGRSFAESIRQRIIAPLGLARTDPAVTQDGRLTTATGYQYLFDDRPPYPGAPLVPAGWNEYSAGDANLVTTAPDLARFLVALLGQGGLPGERLLQPRSFARMVQRTVPAEGLGPDEFYGYGVLVGYLDSDPVLWHSGGMPGFRAMMIGDLDERVGVVLLMNGPGEPRRLGEYALRALIAARRGREPPPVPVAAPPDSIPAVTDYAGSFTDSAGARILLRAQRAHLFLDDGRGPRPLLRAGTDAFLVVDTAWARFPLRAVRSGNQVVELLHGGRWFRAEGAPAPASRAAPAAWQAYVGHYRALVPFDSNFRVIVRHGLLLLVSPEGIEEPLVPERDGTFRVGTDERSPERVTFQDVISGRALRLDLSGTAYYRATSP